MPEVISEFDGSGNVMAHYGYGPGPDEPLLWYDANIPVWRALHADERGSIIAVGDWSGGVAINRYDEYGMPQSGNYGRFQYTGQMWLPEAGVYHYKARDYAPDLPRFLQPDPIGYEDSANLYGYVAADPINFTDPTGLCPALPDWLIGICGARPDDPYQFKNLFDGPLTYAPPGTHGGGGGGGPSEPRIVITAPHIKPKPSYCSLFRSSPGVATLGVGGSVSAKLPGNVRGSATGGAGVAIGGNWDLAFYITGGGGPTTAGTSVGGGFTVGGSNNARSVRDLRDFFSYISGQYGGLAISRYSGYGENKNKVTGIEATIGLGTGKSASAGGTETWVSPVLNVIGLIGC